MCGNTAIIDGVTTMARWALIDRADDGAYSASNIPAGTGRGSTNRRARVRYAAYLPVTGVLPHFPGDSVSFTGNVDGTNGVTVTTVCKRVRIIANLEAAQPYFYYECELWNKEDDLAYGAAAATDTSDPDVLPASALDVNFGGTNENAVAESYLEFVVETRERAGTDVPGWWVNQAGCRLDCVCRWRLYEGTPTNLETPNTTDVLKWYVTDALYWQVEDVIIRAVDGWGPDHEGNKPVGGWMEAQMNMATDGSGVGSVVDPGSTTKWPYP